MRKEVVLTYDVIRHVIAAILASFHWDVKELWIDVKMKTEHTKVTHILAENGSYQISGTDRPLKSETYYSTVLQV